MAGSRAIPSAAQKKLNEVGKTVKMRALEKGYYGLRGEIADIIQPGQVFDFAVADLEEHSKVDALKKPGETITIDKVKYHVPAWMEDASKKPKEVEAEEDEPESGSADDDVL